MPHGSTDSRKPGGPEQCEPLASLTAKPVIEPLHPQHMDALAPPAVEPIERDPVAGCVERRRQLPSQGDLLLLDGPPIRGEVLYRGGRIQEDENAQIAACLLQGTIDVRVRSEEHTSELQSLMRISYAVFCL